MSTHSILDDYLATILQLLQKYGWYLVGLIIIIMIARPYIIEWMNKISINSSSNIKRKELLDEHRKQIREKQQEEQEKIQNENQKVKTVKPEKVITSLGSNNNNNDTNKYNGNNVSYSPLAGGGGFTSNYRPSSEMRNRGRGG